ncbi:CPBP family glutamic-type intramembrane protease [Sphingomonas sp. KRR8]|uniref:CPBP family glutamic-type intramembrane protease n=1 Tax=Sphingomonas sp. KRR8 TaxID=2942996 RepID=UPI002020ED07|nr:CPBP family glutamic-type intramembrane protease [Sphingomonas sp. KRR8]URD60515.1 CPBP family glutamic-type intramembrane protease [Sphingomonas sp. KRR8]
MSERSTSVGPVGRLVPEVWRDWFAFLRAPSLHTPRERFGLVAVRAVLWLLVLGVLVDLPLASLLGWLSKRATLATPQLEQLTRNGPAFTLLLGALMAPLMEEVLFRSWLDGKRRHITFFLMVLLTFGVFWKFGAMDQPLLAIGLALVLLLVGAALVWRADRTVPQWFVRLFPAIFYLQAIAFAGSHFSNYPLDRPWLLVPFVLPQLVAGLIFGFARVRYGMWANLTLHASSNAFFLALTLAGGS